MTLMRCRDQSLRDKKTKRLKDFHCVECHCMESKFVLKIDFKT